MQITENYFGFVAFYVIRSAVTQTLCDAHSVRTILMSKSRSQSLQR